MKFFIFTCLLAVALAKHKMEHSSSSEESVNISQEKFKHEKNVIIHPIKESAKNTKEMDYSSISSSEESAEVSTEEYADVSNENKINQFYQKLNYLQYLQAIPQPQIVMNPWDQVKARAFFFPTVNREQLSTNEESASFSKEETPKTVEKESTEILTHKIKLAKENKNNQKVLNKMAQQHNQKAPLPQYFKTVQYQPAMKPGTNVYQTIPNVVRYF